MKEKIENLFRESISVKEETLKKHVDSIEQAVGCILKSFQNDGKVMFCGNGGSAADSQHIAAEFIGRFQKERQALPAIALTTDTSILTALGNDYGYDIVFARQIEALGKSQDVLFGISTSGNSKNVVEAFKKAKQKGLKIIALTGEGGGAMKEYADILIDIPSTSTARIQESHICVSHIVCDLVESHYA